MVPSGFARISQKTWSWNDVPAVTAPSYSANDLSKRDRKSRVSQIPSSGKLLSAPNSSSSIPSADLIQCPCALPDRLLRPEVLWPARIVRPSPRSCLDTGSRSVASGRVSRVTMVPLRGHMMAVPVGKATTGRASRCTRHRESCSSSALRPHHRVPSRDQDDVVLRPLWRAAQPAVARACVPDRLDGSRRSPPVGGSRCCVRHDTPARSAKARTSSDAHWERRRDLLQCNACRLECCRAGQKVVESMRDVEDKKSVARSEHSVDAREPTQAGRSRSQQCSAALFSSIAAKRLEAK